MSNPLSFLLTLKMQEIKMQKSKNLQNTCVKNVVKKVVKNNRDIDMLLII